MIQQISRQEVFSRSRLVDYYISSAQWPYYYNKIHPYTIDFTKTEDENFKYEYIILEETIFDNPEDDYSIYSDEERGSLLEDLNDHTEPLHDGKKLTNDSAVLAYLGKNIADYIANRSKALIHFFEIMQIRQLYLIDNLRYDWLRFPFKSDEKRAALKRLVNAPSYREAFEIDIEDLEIILPLFDDSSRHSIPIIYLYSTNDKVPIVMFLCDDGNFHTSFHTEDREKIFYAASAVGMAMGGVELC